jgi:hypothetical protein
MRPSLFTIKTLSGLWVCFCILAGIVSIQAMAIAQSSPVVKPQITYKLIGSEHNTWGYDIYIDGKLRIHQPSIPAVSGNDGFKTKHQCEIAIKLVTDKIKLGKMPPTVTVDELKKAGAI